MQMLTSKFQSSGDLIADRRFEWARDCEAKGDLAGAADLMRQALEIAPGYASAWFALGVLREKLGDRPGAVEAYRRACEADPQDKHGAALMLMRLGAELTGEMPQAYVRELFDQYAPAFDKALQENLQYRAPALLRTAIQTVCKDYGRPLRFASMLDLGCGTGLAGEAFRAIVDRLVGVDLSPGMIAEAKKKCLYDRLVVADMMQFLSEETRDRVQYELVLAADVFVYAADLHQVIAGICGTMAPQGLLAFTVETYAGDAVILGEKLRYAHGEPLVRTVLSANGLETIHLEHAATRTEGGVPLPGLVVIAAATRPRSQSQA
jgi:predicted TPR repeat methyltransferase